MRKSIFTSAADVEAAFYDALAKANVDALMAVWSEDDDVVCIHPDGTRLTNLANIREGWQQIFDKPASRKLHVAHRVTCANMMLTVYSNVETSTLAGNRTVTVLATHVYTRSAMGWRLVMRHASTTEAIPVSVPASSILH